MTRPRNFLITTALTIGLVATGGATASAATPTPTAPTAPAPTAPTPAAWGGVSPVVLVQPGSRHDDWDWDWDWRHGKRHKRWHKKWRDWDKRWDNSWRHHWRGDLWRWNDDRFWRHGLGLGGIHISIG